MIQPLCSDFLTGTLPSSAFDVVARHIGEEAVYPDSYLFLSGFELTLAVNGPNLRAIWNPDS